MLVSNTFDSGVKATPLLIAHGLFGSARNWGVIAKRLSDGRPVTAVDMRNHGDSAWFESHRYGDMADDLAQSIVGDADVLGHSMGGKAAMALALQRPEKIRKLIVADIAPVGYSHTQIPLIEAMRSIDLTIINTRGDAERQLQASVDDAGVRAFLMQSLDVKGRRWRLNLDVLAQEMEHIIGFPDLAGKFEGPAFFLSGGESDYVLPEYRARIRQLFPAAIFAKIPGVGHWLHAEKPREFEAAVSAFLNA